MNSTKTSIAAVLACIVGFCLVSSVKAQQTPWRLIGPGDADQVTAITTLPNGAVWVGTDIGGLYKSVDRGASWVAKNNGLNNLDVTTPLVYSSATPGSLFVGTRGGLFRSQDGGESWLSVRDGLPKKERFTLSGSIGALAVDPFDPSKLLLGMGYRPSYDGNVTIQRLQWLEHLYRSEDGGRSWTKQPAFTKPTRVNQIVFSSAIKHLVYAATDSGLYRSDDGGGSWELLWDGKALNVAERADAPRHLLLAIVDGVIGSKDGGKSWSASNSGLRTSVVSGLVHSNRYCCFAQNSLKPESIVVANSSWGQGGGLYSSDNFGESWRLTTERQKLPESWLASSSRFNAISISNTGTASSIYAGSSRYLYRSDDNGDSWIQLISTQTDTGWRHTGINVFGQTRQLLVDVDDPSIMFIGTADHKLVKSVDAGVSWRLLERDNRDASNIWGMAMCPLAPKTLYAVSSEGTVNLCLMKSHNKGESWQTSCGGLGTADWNERILIDPENCDRIYVGTRNGVFVSGNAGAGWMRLATFPTTKVYDLAFGANSRTIYVATQDGLLKSTDQGENWVDMTPTIKQPVTAVMVSKGDPDTVFLGTRSGASGAGRIYRSRDGGKNWRWLQGDISGYVTGFAQLPSDKSVIYASTTDNNSHDDSKGSGIYRTTDQGDTWTTVNDGLPVFRGYRVTTSELYPNSIFFATDGSGVYVQEYEK